MIVEDDPMVREINSKFLKKIEGFNLCAAVSNLVDAKQKIVEKKPNLILLDVYLPKENGIDLLKWIRIEEKNIDVILITADKSIEIIQKGLRYGVIDYLIKPFSFDRFKEALLQFKNQYQQFNKKENIEQDDLDKIKFLTNSVQNDEDFAKGFSKYTYKIIWNEISSGLHKEFTAEGIAEKLGVARVTVRRYLDYMEKEDKLKKVVEYGKVGRPQYKYHRI